METADRKLTNHGSLCGIAISACARKLSVNEMTPRETEKINLWKYFSTTNAKHTRPRLGRALTVW